MKRLAANILGPLPVLESGRLCRILMFGMPSIIMVPIDPSLVGDHSQIWMIGLPAFD